MYIFNALPVSIEVSVSPGPDFLTDQTVCDEKDGDGDEEEGDAEHDRVVGVLEPTTPGG